MDGLHSFLGFFLVNIHIFWNVSENLSGAGVDGLHSFFFFCCKYSHFLEWSRKTFPDNPNAITDTETDADSKRFRIHYAV